MILLTGTSRPFGDGHSAIHKQPVNGALFCSVLGLPGDDVADPRFHGGADRALHYYPEEHYQFWAHYWQSLGLAAAPTPFEAGAFGENLCGQGWTEHTVCVGDRFRLGGTLLEVSEPRCPCHKLNTRFDYGHMALQVQLTHRCGWFFRVIEEGEIDSGDTLERVERDPRGLTLARCNTILYGQPFHREDLTLLAEHPRLTAVWKNHARRWIETGIGGDWHKRLFSHPATSQ
ncbi:MOSC domain-containing protein [Ferrimonas futtsuensis]|uniref:MOSC domain-containing protein n=1 Tax=Ferrimonas futtsuensis TaxID=364764 RepID=UPI000427DFEA|nr:MOSC domain-containing protein [Ferrimonas futtsuensis]